jgi:hypothetical protein
MDNAYKLMDLLYKNPIVTINDVSECIDKGFITATTLIKDFQRLGILEEITGNKRKQEFAFSEYLTALAFQKDQNKENLILKNRKKPE